MGIRKLNIMAFVLSVLMITAFIPTTAFAAASSTNLSAKASIGKVAVGDTFTVTVSTKATELATFIGGVNYNNSVLECKKIEGFKSDEEGVFLQKSASDDYVGLDAENNASGGSVGFYLSKPGDVKYRAQDFMRITFRAKSAGDCGITLYENSSGTEGYSEDPIDAGINVTAIVDDDKNPETDQNISATADTEKVRVGDTFTVTISTDEMKVSTFTGGINFNKDEVEYQGYAGFRSGKDGAFLTKATGDFAEVDVQEAETNDAVGLMLINSNNVSYKAGNLVKLTFKALKAGPIHMSLYENSAGYDGYVKDPIEVDFSVTAVTGSETNLSASASSAIVGRGESVNVTMSVKAMKVSTFTGGIRFDKSYLKLTGINGCRKGYSGVYLKKTNGNYEQLTAEAGSGGENAGFILVNPIEANYFAQDFITFEFEAVRNGTTEVSFYEDSTGYDGYSADPLDKKITLEIKDVALYSVMTEKSSYVATGSAIEPNVIVTDTIGRVLVRGTDYEVSYSDNINAGTATVTITGTGKYEGTISTTFTITSSGGGGGGGAGGGGAGGGETAQKEIKEVLIPQQIMYYTGSEIKPAVTVKNSEGSVLTEGKDYTVSYKNNISIGVATITVTGKGDYSGQIKTIQFTIAGKFVQEIVLEKSSYAYTGKNIVPKVKVLDANKVVLEEGKDYTIKCSNNKAVGKAEITATGMGDFQGTVEASFKIVPKGTTLKSVKSSRKQATVKWNKPSSKYLAQTTGYVIQYGTSADFAGKDVKSVKVGKKTATSKTIKKLKSGKKYYFRVAVYKSKSDGLYQSAWSKAKKIKVK